MSATTPGELAKELDTDPRNIILHLETATKLGVSISEWINMLKELPTVKDVAAELGVSETTVRRWLKNWLKKHDLKPEYYEYYERKKVRHSSGRIVEIAVRTLRVPQKFLLEVFKHE